MLIKLAKEIEKALKQKKSILWDKGHENHGSLVQELTKVMLDFPEKPEGTEIKFEQPKTYSKVILFSGGMDSAIMWWINQEIEDKIALYVNFGHQYAQQEINSLQRIVGDGAMIKIVDYPLDFGSEWKHIIPTRNFVLLALAEQLCSHEGEIWLGAVEGESAPDKGDKSELFFRMVEELIWRTKHKKINIKDLKAHTKSEWLFKYLHRTEDMSILDTVSCFAGTEKACGKCQTCVRKWLAMRHCMVPNAENYFEVNPYEGGNQYIQKYKVKMQEALDKQDFSHYSHSRCVQDLSAINVYEEELARQPKLIV